MTSDGKWNRRIPKLRWRDLVKEDITRNERTTEMAENITHWHVIIQTGTLRRSIEADRWESVNAIYTIILLKYVAVSKLQMRMSLFSLSSHLIFGRLLGRVPVTVILNVLLVMWVSSLRIICPYHDSRFWVRVDLIGVTLAIPLMVSFLILSFLVFPWLHLIIFISVVCKRCSSCLRSAQHSLPYNDLKMWFRIIIT